MNKSTSRLVADGLGPSSLQLRLLVTVALFVGTACAQTTAPAAAPSTQPSVISELDTYVKILGAAITGIATLLGLPIVFVTYKKDCRNDLYGTEFIRSYITAMKARTGWEEILREYSVTVALVPQGSAVRAALAGSESWNLDYQDQTAAIFARTKR
ncbi:MAG TPA: hypothetical protein VEK84_16725 [Terriglobales bacterium]|nr:hypothetical protein [Terriglobales bacterium]